MFSGHFWIIWDAIQWIARRLPHDTLTEEQKIQFIQLISSLTRLVPCPGCQLHGEAHLAKHPLTLENVSTGQQAFEYVIAFHNAVNTENGKVTMTPDDAERAMILRMERDYKNAIRGEALEKESQTQISHLEKEIYLLRDVRFAATNESVKNYVIVAIVIAALCLLFVILFGILVLRNVNPYVKQTRKQKPISVS